ncbi:MAG TPA: hypothetical protein VGD79_07215 [Thermoanaerobaculia bacterium]|jgi:hypothetical protein
MTKRAGLALALFSLLLATFGCAHGRIKGDNYATHGVHNLVDCEKYPCNYATETGRPPDPIYPPYWVSPWTMYTLFGDNYVNYPPPYNGKPPAPLKEGVDYTVSFGASYYDSTYVPTGASANPGKGAMMEHYEKRCLPIFAIDNHYTCSFISLGDVAYFVTYEDRPSWMPPVCLFSPWNHPPARDFINHLPYSTADSQRLGIPGAQAYSMWVSAITGKPVQTGAAPVHPKEDPVILFGYAFAPVNGTMQPQSFYFSGYPFEPADAPIVTQNYMNFSATQPDPKQTWDQVSGIDPSTLPLCQLFDPPKDVPPQGVVGAVAPVKRAPTWGDIGRWPKQ